MMAIVMLKEVAWGSTGNPCSVFCRFSLSIKLFQNKRCKTNIKKPPTNDLGLIYAVKRHKLMIRLPCSQSLSHPGPWQQLTYFLFLYFCLFYNVTQMKLYSVELSVSDFLLNIQLLRFTEVVTFIRCSFL